jgi:hypothetical protein
MAQTTKKMYIVQELAVIVIVAVVAIVVDGDATRFGHRCYPAENSGKKKVENEKVEIEDMISSDTLIGFYSSLEVKDVLKDTSRYVPPIADTNLSFECFKRLTVSSFQEISININEHQCECLGAIELHQSCCPAHPSAYNDSRSD